MGEKGGRLCGGVCIELQLYIGGVVKGYYRPKKEKERKRKKKLSPRAFLGCHEVDYFMMPALHGMYWENM